MVKRLAAWTEGSTNRKVAGAMLTVGLITVVVKSASLGKDMLVAGQFGTGTDLDAFVIALIIPTFAAGIVIETIRIALLPTYVEVRDGQGPAAAHRLLLQVTTAAALGAAVLSLVLLVAAPGLLGQLGRSFGPEKLELTRSLFVILLPTLVLAAFSSTWSAALNADDHNAVVALAPALYPLVPALALAVAPGDVSIFTLAYATLGGAVAQTVLLGLALRRRGLRLLPALPSLTPEMRTVATQYLPLVAGATIAGGTLLIDQSMATSFGDGAASALNYGMKGISLLLGIGELALSMTFLPLFARLATARDWTGLRSTLRTWTRVVLLVSVPVTVVAIAVSRPAVALLFERGEFGADDTAMVAQIQILFLLQVPAFACLILYLRLIAALQRNWFLMLAAIATLVLNVAGNLLFGRWIGLPGIALATSVVTWLKLGYMGATALWLLRKREESSGPMAPTGLAGASGGTVTMVQGP
jgi:putative peptidoglycan lipid II flippase